MFAVFAFMQDQSFNHFENNTMKLSVNEAKLAGLRARNCTTIQQVLILKFAFGPEKFSAAFEKQATGTTHYEALRTSAWEAKLTNKQSCFLDHGSAIRGDALKSVRVCNSFFIHEKSKD